jgi:hypothetical protein
MPSIPEMFAELSIFSWRDIIELAMMTASFIFVIHQMQKRKQECLPILICWMSAVIFAWLASSTAIQIFLYFFPIMFPFVFWFSFFRPQSHSSQLLHGAIKETITANWPTEVMRALISSSYKHKNVMIICTDSVQEIEKHIAHCQHIDVAVSAALLERLILTAETESALVMTLNGRLRLFDIKWSDMRQAQAEVGLQGDWMSIFSQCAFLPNSIFVTSSAEKHAFMLMIENKIYEHISAAQVLSKMEQFVERQRTFEQNKKIKGQNESISAL